MRVNGNGWWTYKQKRILNHWSGWLSTIGFLLRHSFTIESFLQVPFVIDVTCKRNIFSILWEIIRWLKKSGMKFGFTQAEGFNCETLKDWIMFIASSDKACLFLASLWWIWSCQHNIMAFGGNQVFC